MPDIYLYEGTDVLKNLLDIRDRKILMVTKGTTVNRNNTKNIALRQNDEDCPKGQSLFYRLLQKSVLLHHV